MADSVSSQDYGLFELGGKLIVITGGAGLLGSTYADAILTHNGKVVLLDISQTSLNRCLEHLSSKFNDSSIFGYQIDLTDEDSVQQTVNEITRTHGPVHALINNAANNPKVEQGESDFTDFETFPIDRWKADLDVGLTGAFLCTKYFGKTMAENKNGGVIINISSDLGLISPDQRLYRRPGQPEEKQPKKPVSYSVTKTGIIGLTRYTATYWADKGIRCNALCLGGVENGQSPEFIKNVSQLIPLNRMAEPTEYQGTLIWLLSSASSYVNGAVIAVDGGRTTW